MLKFNVVDKAKPSSGETNKVEEARKRFIENNKLQLKMAEALAEGAEAPVFTEEKNVRGDDGKMTKATKSYSPRPWFFLADNAYFFAPRYSNKSVLGKNKAIRCGDVKQLPKTITQVIEAATAGDFDDRLMSCSRHK